MTSDLPLNGAIPFRAGPDGSHFAPSLLYAAAQLYYEEDATQAEIATRLGTSRATVSRLLSEARRQGIVRIEVRKPTEAAHGDLSGALALALGVKQVYLSAAFPPATPSRPAEDLLGQLLAPAVGQALLDVGLVPGDVLLVSSGRTMYEVGQAELPKLPGVLVAPTVGGTDQPEGWFQTNEITRLIASRIGGRATYLFAPALPGPELYGSLLDDPTIQRVLHLWPHARAVLTGVGAPPLLRSQMPQFVPGHTASLVEAIGDICSRFFDRAGNPVHFPGDDRLIAVELAQLQQLPMVIAVAAGADKVAPVIAAAKAGYFSRLVTDPQTAQQILTALA